MSLNLPVNISDDVHTAFNFYQTCHVYPSNECIFSRLSSRPGNSLEFLGLFIGTRLKMHQSHREVEVMGTAGAFLTPLTEEHKLFISTDN